ncbi:MAG: HAD family phosphatase, partial [Planctomycetales bacterium]|nr:HAD family phosphatase [Planctomycetales bacterium]
MLPARLEPMPGLLSLLTALESRGIPKAITTSSQQSFVERILSLANFDFEFHFHLTAESVANGKPHPEIYLSAADAFGVAPSRMMVLEDSENGCRAATAAGAFAVAVPTHMSASHDFANVRFIADSLADERIYRTLKL